MSDIKCCKTPILDLLRSTPVDGRATHEEGSGVGLRYHMIPYGKHCHEAADEIERLRAVEGKLKDDIIFAAKKLDEKDARIEELEAAAQEDSEEVKRWMKRVDESEWPSDWEFIVASHEERVVELTARIERLQEELANESSLRAEETQELEVGYKQAIAMCEDWEKKNAEELDASMDSHIITDKQISAAWRLSSAYANSAGCSWEVLEELGIKRCNCEREIDHWTEGEGRMTTTVCPTCNGKGWTKDGE